MQNLYNTTSLLQMFLFWIVETKRNCSMTYFPNQYTPNIKNSVLPTWNFLTDKRIDQVSTHYEEIISLIRNLNPNKASGPDGISGQMLLLCDNSVVLPLKIIFQILLVNSTYPDMWKLPNVTPIFKKGDKQLIKNYRQIFLLLICGNIFKKNCLQ